MLTIQKEAFVSDDGVIILKGFLHLAGHKVKIIINDIENKFADKNYSLKGSVKKYENPFDSVAENDWEINK